MFCFIILVCRLFGVSSVYGRISVTSRPHSLYGTEDTISVAWTGTTNPCSLRFGEQVGVYDSTVSIPGIGSLSFVPENEGMYPGAIRWIITDGADSSLEYDLLIETGSAGVPGNWNINPANSDTLQSIQELVPMFRWEAKTAQIPYYHIVVLDERISLDWRTGELKNVSIIWQAIIPGTELQYMTPDPSGFFSDVTPPPLLNGKTYYWTVFNNLNGTPAYTSDRLGNPFKFTVDAPQLDSGLTAPVISAPADSSVQSGTISFIWSPASGMTGTVTYSVYLYETGFFPTGDTCRYLLWKGSTANTSALRLYNSDLKGGWYKWMVVAEAGDRRIASASAHFQYNQPVRAVAWDIRDTYGNPLPRVTIAGPSGSLPVFTGEDGTARNVFHTPAEGDTISFTYTMDGHQTAETTVILMPDTSVLLLPVTMTPLSSMFTGTVCDDAAGFGIRNAIVTVLENGNEFKAMTDLYGNYRVYADSGNWNFFYQKEGYQTQALLNRVIDYDDVMVLPDVSLQENSGLISITVQDDQASMLPGASLYAFRLEAGDTTARNTGITDGTGQYSFTASAGYWKIVASKAGYDKNFTSCTVEADDLVNRTVVLINAVDPHPDIFRVYPRQINLGDSVLFEMLSWVPEGTQEYAHEYTFTSIPDCNLPDSCFYVWMIRKVITSDSTYATSGYTGPSLKIGPRTPGDYIIHYSTCQPPSEGGMCYPYSMPFDSASFSVTAPTGMGEWEAIPVAEAVRANCTYDLHGRMFTGRQKGNGIYIVIDGSGKCRKEIRLE